MGTMKLQISWFKYNSSNIGSLLIYEMCWLKNSPCYLGENKNKVVEIGTETLPCINLVPRVVRIFGQR